MKILVTGADGQLGRKLRDIFNDEPIYTVLFVGHGEMDITDTDSVERTVSEFDPDVVVNCAAYTNVEKAEAVDYALANAVNAEGPRHLAEACLRHDCKLIHVSTDYVFSGDRNVPYSTDETSKPINVYGQTKRIGERFIEDSGCRYIIIRTSWLYSEYGKNFMKTMDGLIGSRETADVVIDQIGSPTYAGDLASFIDYIIFSGDYMTKNGLFHFSDRGTATWYDFACAVKELKGEEGAKTSIRPVPSTCFIQKAERPHYSVMDCSKTEAVFGYEIPYWRDSLKKCWQKHVFLKNRN